MLYICDDQCAVLEWRTSVTFFFFFLFFWTEIGTWHNSSYTFSSFFLGFGICYLEKTAVALLKGGNMCQQWRFGCTMSYQVDLMYVLRKSVAFLIINLLPPPFTSKEKIQVCYVCECWSLNTPSLHPLRKGKKREKLCDLSTSCIWNQNANLGAHICWALDFLFFCVFAFISFGCLILDLVVCDCMDVETKMVGWCFVMFSVWDINRPMAKQTQFTDPDKHKCWFV